MTRLKDVALQAGVSVSTVSRVMRGYPHVKPEVRNMVLAAAAELGYRTNVVARSMRVGQSRSIGLIVRDMRSANFAEICAGAEAVAEENDYDLFVCNSNRSTDKERRYVDSLLQRQVDALILFAADDRVRNTDAIHAAGRAVVLVSSGLEDHRADRVDTGDSIASEVGTSHLIGLGHHRIGYLAWGQQIPSGRGRLEGFRAAHAASGLVQDDNLVRYCEFDGREAGLAVASLLSLERPITALVAAATDLVPSALEAVRASGIDVPQELSLLAFDDRDATRYFRPPVTVMKRRVVDIGREAMSLALWRLSNPDAPPRTVSVPFELVVRGSTGPV